MVSKEAPASDFCPYFVKRMRSEREVQEFLTANHMANVVAGMFALCRAISGIFQQQARSLCRHAFCLSVIAVVATRAPDKGT